MGVEYRMDARADAKAIADLREAIGWNRMEEDYENPAMDCLFAIGAYHGERLIGHLCVVSNRVTDAYIQDVMVHPEFQGQGIGSELMRQAIERIREMGIYMISVIYGEETLRAFYEKFGFHTMLCGQRQIREE